ncbi:MAG TPA: erythromycin esterase family protein [Gemmatimonadaceae bacterium]|nr:erythromycin esterase family protein [Gemmatimonadaceae bacterium]
MLAGVLLAALAGCRFSDIPGFQQPQLPIDTTRVVTPPAQDIGAWLRDSSTAVRSLAFDDTDWSDLDALADAIGTRRVVLLGEQSGGDGTTLRAKARLVRYLHERHGFDALVFEGGIYDLRAADARLEAGDDAEEVLRRALPDPWRSSAELAPLFAWLGTQRQAGAPLRLGGIDPRVTSRPGAFSAPTLGATLETYLARYGSPVLAEATWPRLRVLLDSVGLAGDVNPSATPETREALASGLERLRTETDRLVNVATESEAAPWRMVIAGLQVREAWALRRDAGQADTAAMLRQEAMAEALVDAVQSVFGGTRVIVWTSSESALRSSRELLTVTGEARETPTPAFGERAREVLGDDQLYALGFLAASGTYGPFEAGASVRPLVRPPPESWDGLFLAAGRPLAFLHLRRSPTTDNIWLYERRVARALGYQQVAARWPFVFDGFFFTADMAPVATTR